MPIYDLTELDVKNLVAIIAAAPIKGSDALTVVNLVNKLKKPINGDVQTNFPPPFPENSGDHAVDMTSPAPQGEKHV
jgi:hypothetical protein